MKTSQFFTSTLAVLAVALIVTASPHASAATVFFQGGTTGNNNTSWNTASNWTDFTSNYVPTSADTVVFNPWWGTANAVIDVNASASELQLGRDGVVGTLSLNSAFTLNVGVVLELGYSGTGNTYTFNMSNGAVNADVFRFSTYNTAKGVLNLSGGTVTTQSLLNGNPFEMNLSGSGKFVITDGYNNTAYWLNQVNGYMTSGYITGAQAQIVGNTVEITAVPEPSTYALVLGGIATLLLIRRRVQA